MATPAYAIAHRLLPERFFTNPAQLVERLTGPGAAAVLAALWEEAGGSPGREPSCQIHELAAGGRMALVTIAAASSENPGEAALVALVCRPGQDAASEVAEYFTLEHSIDLGDGPATMLCERSGDGRHLNHGLGPRPDTGRFIEALHSQIRRRLT
jgi:hypothetical protein